MGEPDAVFVGVDIGTYESKGVVVDQHGRVIASARRGHAVDFAPDGRAEHDAETVWWQGLCGVLTELAAHPDVDLGRCAAVACSGIGPCVLSVDEDFTPLGPAALYGIDTRAVAEGRALTERLGRRAIRERAGNDLTSQSAGPKIAWLAAHQPQVHARARWFLTCQSFLVARLTGEVVVDHATASYFHPLYDLRAGAWDVAGCEDFIDAARLPRLAWAGEVAGTVTPTAARSTGLPVGTPVLVGTADAQAEAFGSGVVDPGDLMVMYGSSSFMIQVRDTVPTQLLTWNAPYVVPGRFGAAAGTSTAGTAVRWLLDLLELPTSDDGFARVVELATAAAPGADGLIFLPHLAGERTPWFDEQARGVFAGLSLAHRRQHLARAVLEGVAHSMVVALDVLVQGATSSRVTAVGGGTRNPVWLQAVSDISGLEQAVVTHPGASYGGAALAALAVGAITSPGDVRRWIGEPAVIRPRTDLGPAYRSDHERFVELYHAARDAGRTAERADAPTEEAP